MPKLIGPGTNRELLGEVEGVKVYVETHFSHYQQTYLELEAFENRPHMDASFKVNFEILLGRILQKDSVGGVFNSIWLAEASEFWLRVEALVLERVDLPAFKQQILEKRVTLQRDLLDTSRKHVAAIEATFAGAVKALADFKNLEKELPHES